VKFGITSGDPKHRLDVHMRDGFIHQVYVRENFPDAKKLEDAVKKHLRECGFKPLWGNEYFSDDALPFIKSLLPE
jgi:hypothetical protein